MSASPMAKSVETKSIAIKRVQIQDASDLPSHYSSTPGGTLFSTTPGGTKIVYEKSVLMTLRNSPISRTPPKFDIPEHLLMGGPSRRHSNKNSAIPNGINKSNNNNSKKRDAPKINKSNEHDEQFSIEL